VTTPHERDGALAAVERIVNRGSGDVVAETLALLRRLYADVELGADGSIVAAGATEDDAPFLRRVAVLISAHLP
jgi:hypothetical protein